MYSVDMRAVIVFCLMSLSLVAAFEWPSKRLTDKIVDFSLYQIYPRSFKDSDGDGIGDLKGITSKLDHLVESNIDALWLSPIYPSPMVDFGYDISNFVDIDPVFGTLSDLESLLKTAHKKGLKVFLDFVPNHSSDQHEWFRKSEESIEPYTNYYIWKPGRVVNGVRHPPNNWVSAFGGPAWTWSEKRQAYYFHQFSAAQPDLNYRDKHVVREMKNVLRFWLRKGIDGFRMDALPYLFEDDRFLDEPLSGNTNNPNDPEYTKPIYTKDQPETYKQILDWRLVLDEFEQPKFIMIEAYANMSMTMKYYAYGANYPFNFGLIVDVNKRSTASDFKKTIESWMENMPAKSTPNWVAGNHDQPRLATRFGPSLARAVTMMTLLLPGVGVTYNGDEIGMENTWLSWEDTQDPQGCNAGKQGYEAVSRDPERSPFQWDDSVSAGFSTNPKTWLPVNDNYQFINLAEEKKDKNSYYNFYKKVSALKKSPYFKRASLITKLLNENVFAFARETKGHGSVYAIANFANTEETVDLSVFDNVSYQLNVYYISDGSTLLSGDSITDIQRVRIPALGLAILITPGAKFGNE
ncbi:PREDICTED: alpha-glucosidase-like isoform X1 [Eufriesea mexicana]|uniref:alpha-glucosidase-like isoform X1 n=2 Tax=Eufriesea mexicana TaxID=516756 RepID=UPI00083C5697|nr:PREDICTED: alpha-glucosidase-like isoform X1 [Eufriesea mexicana]